MIDRTLTTRRAFRRALRDLDARLLTVIQRFRL